MSHIFGKVFRMPAVILVQLLGCRGYFLQLLGCRAVILVQLLGCRAVILVQLLGCRAVISYSC